MGFVDVLNLFVFGGGCLVELDDVLADDKLVVGGRDEENGGFNLAHVLDGF